MTGTMEFMAKRTERNPRASALDATAVFTDKTDTNTADSDDIAPVMIPFSELVNPFKFSPLQSDEQIPTAKKQCVTGRNNVLEIILSP